MANLNIRFAMEPIRELAFGSIVAGYTGIGTPIENPAIQFVIQNLTDTSLMFSLDGVEDHIILPQAGYWNSDITTNQQSGRGLSLPVGTRFYVKRDGIPTSGSVYISICYAK